MLFWKKKKETVTPKQEIKVPQEFNTFGLQDILHYIKREIGVDLFTKNSIIETKLRLFCEKKEIYSFRKLYDNIQHNSELRQALIDLVTVNETYFYREEEQLALAVDFALKISGTINILCAPCASGEEVYSLAMMLQEKNRHCHTFNITGIDINSEAIEKAEKGIFSERSLHKLDQKTKDKFFTCNDKFYNARKELFSSIKFKKINIFDYDFLSIGKFDIIFSRNMLIYFDDEFRMKTIERFSKLLNADGKLFLGHADIIPDNTFFTKYNSHRLSYYIKS